jgi:Na+/H+-translocating membrane pyrophosphatase
MFTALYELILGHNNNPTYANTIFTPVGTLTIVVALGLAAVFYLLLGRWRSVFHQLPHWLLTLAMMAVFGFFYAVNYAKEQTEALDADGYMNTFGLVNAIVGMIAFALFSLILKQFSVFARRTPF